MPARASLSFLAHLPIFRPLRRLTLHWQAVTPSGDQLRLPAHCPLLPSPLPFRLPSPSPHLKPFRSPRRLTLHWQGVISSRSRLRNNLRSFRLTSHPLPHLPPFPPPHRLTLHWQAVAQSGDQLQLALEAKKGTPAAASWFAVGWSQSGKMGGSNVIVMEDVGSAPGEYDLESDPLYTAKAVAASWSASSSSVTESDKSVVLQFSRGISEPGSVPVKRSGYSNMIWAYGAGIWESDGGHDAKGATVVDFSCNGCKGVLRNRC
ncbi:unnamed protein product [Closterium sp. NIES-53]